MAISNSRLLRFDEQGVSFRWKDYRGNQRFRHKTMTLDTDEFIRRFLIHVLPSGFHRIRHYGLLANSGRRDNLERARKLLAESVEENAIVTALEQAPQSADAPDSASVVYLCPDCGSPMVIIECFERGQLPRAPPIGIFAS